MFNPFLQFSPPRECDNFVSSFPVRACNSSVLRYLCFIPFRKLPTWKRRIRVVYDCFTECFAFLRGGSWGSSTTKRVGGGGGNIEMETLSQPFTFERRQGSQSRREDNLSRGYKLEISNETLSARGSAIENTLVFVIFELLYVHGTIKYTKSNKLNCSVSCTVIWFCNLNFICWISSNLI